jgi:hypothetical protein
MNVIQQEALAKSVGMSRDELAKTLMDQAVLNKLKGVEGKTAKEKFDNLVKEVGLEKAKKQLGDESLANQFAGQNVQERFAATMEKVKEIFISLAEPLLPILEIFTDIFKIIGPIVGLIGKMVHYAAELGKPFLMVYGVLKGISLTTKGITALNSILLTQNTSILAKKTTEAGLEQVKLGLGQRILLTLGLQDAILAYQMAKEEGLVGFAATREFLEQTILGKLLLQGFQLTKNLVQYIALTLQSGFRMVMENTILGSIIAQTGGILKSIGVGAIRLVQSIATAAAELLGVSALTLGIGTAVALAAAAGGIAYLYSVTKGDDVMSQGYGKRTLLAGKDAITLNDEDTVIAGTDLGGKNKPKNNTGETTSQNNTASSIDITPLIDRMAAVEGLLSQILQKETNIYMDSTKVGTGFAMSTSKVQ